MNKYIYTFVCVFIIIPNVNAACVFSTDCDGILNFRSERGIMEYNCTSRYSALLKHMFIKQLNSSYAELGLIAPYNKFNTTILFNNTYCELQIYNFLMLKGIAIYGNNFRFNDDMNIFKCAHTTPSILKYNNTNLVIYNGTHTITAPNIICVFYYNTYWCFQVTGVSIIAYYEHSSKSCILSNMTGYTAKSITIPKYVSYISPTFFSTYYAYPGMRYIWKYNNETQTGLSSTFRNVTNNSTLQFCAYSNFYSGCLKYHIVLINVPNIGTIPKIQNLTAKDSSGAIILQSTLNNSYYETKQYIGLKEETNRIIITSMYSSDSLYIYDGATLLGIYNSLNFAYENCHTIRIIESDTTYEYKANIKVEKCYVEFMQSYIQLMGINGFEMYGNRVLNYYNVSKGFFLFDNYEFVIIFTYDKSNLFLMKHNNVYCKTTSTTQRTSLKRDFCVNSKSVSLKTDYCSFNPVHVSYEIDNNSISMGNNDVLPRYTFKSEIVCAVLTRSIFKSLICFNCSLYHGNVHILYWLCILAVFSFLYTLCMCIISFRILSSIYSVYKRNYGLLISTI